MMPDYSKETREQKQVRILQKLYELRDDYSSEIPREVIHNEGRYKVRSAWFGTVWLYFDILFRNQFIQEHLIQKRDETMKRINSRRDSNKGLTSILDIEETDELLTEAINYLEQQSESKTL